MAYKFVQFLEGSFIQQKMNALARSELAGFVFALAALRAATCLRFRRNTVELFHAVAMPCFRGQAALSFRQRNLPRKAVPR